MEGILASLKGYKLNIFLVSVIFGSWVALFYLIDGSAYVLLGTNRTQERIDAFHEFLAAPFIMWVGGAAAGWLGCTSYVSDKAKQTKKVKTPG